MQSAGEVRTSAQSGMKQTKTVAGLSVERRTIYLRVSLGPIKFGTLESCLVVGGTNRVHLIGCVIISNISNFLSTHLNILSTILTIVIQLSSNKNPASLPLQQPLAQTVKCANTSCFYCHYFSSL